MIVIAFDTDERNGAGALVAQPFRPAQPCKPAQPCTHHPGMRASHRLSKEHDDGKR